MYKRILALVLSLAMALCLLTGCGKSAAGGDASAAATDPADAQTQAMMEAVAGVVPEEAKSDAVSYLTDGALKRESVVMTVNGKDVTAGYYMFWLGRELNNMNLFYNQYGMPFDLDGEFSEGQTTTEYLDSSAQRASTTYYAIERQAEEQKITLTKEQEKQLEDYVNGLDASAVAYYGTTAEDQRTTFRQNLLSESLNKKLTDSGEIAATEEALTQYVKDQGLYNCRYILYNVAEDADEKTDKEQKEKAQAAYDELSKLSGEEQLKKFQEYQKQNQDGNTDEFQFNPTSTIDEDFRAKVESMEVGELGMTDKTSFGYFVLLRLDVDTESLKEEYLQKTYNDMISQWAEKAEAKPTAEMDKLDVKAVCTKLMELQNSMNEAAQAAVSADESSAEASVPTVDAADMVEEADGAAS